MSKRRRLLDLYVRGQDLTIEDETVWIQKLNPVEHASVVRKADAARAKTLSIKFDKEGEQYLTLLSSVLNADHDLLVDILAAVEEARILPIREAKLAYEDEWKTDNYLQGLRDAWADGVMDAYTADPEDVEAKRVHDEIQRFLTAVQNDISGEMESYRFSLNTMSEQELVNMSMDQRIKGAADVAWVDEYYRSEMAEGIREVGDHRTKYFTRSEIDELQLETYNKLAEAFRDLTVEPLEGKDSAESPPSSASSEPSDKEVTDPSSGPPV